MKNLKIGDWYQYKCSNHLYLVIGIKYDRYKTIKRVICSFYSNLKYCGTKSFLSSEFNSYKKAKLKNIMYLDTYNISEYLEMKKTLDSIKRKLKRTA